MQIVINLETIYINLGMVLSWFSINSISLWLISLKPNLLFTKLGLLMTDLQSLAVKHQGLVYKQTTMVGTPHTCMVCFRKKL